MVSGILVLLSVGDCGMTCARQSHDKYLSSARVHPPTYFADSCVDSNVLSVFPLGPEWWRGVPLTCLNPDTAKSKNGTMLCHFSHVGLRHVSNGKNSSKDWETAFLLFKS